MARRINKKKLFLEAFEKNAGNISLSCKAIGISRKTFYQWLKNDEKFKEEVEAVEESFLDFTESMLKKKIKAGDNTAILFYLKTKGKSRGYIEKQEVDMNSDNRIVIEYNLPEDFKSD